MVRASASFGRGADAFSFYILSMSFCPISHVYIISDMFHISTRILITVSCFGYIFIFETNNPYILLFNKKDKVYL